MLGQY